jgi:DNA-3-methyladenine glycosylase II
VPALEAMPAGFRESAINLRDHKLGSATAPIQNEDGADEGEDPSDLRDALSINPIPPFRLDLSVWALRRRPGNAVDVWDGESYQRALAFIDGKAEISVSQTRGPESPRLAVAIVGDRVRHSLDKDVVATLDRMLGMQVDLSSFYDMAAADSLLRPVVDRFRGLKPPRFPTVFESLCNAVANQQLSLEAGLSLLNRLAAHHGKTVSSGRSSLHAFPGPHELASLEPHALRDLGFSRRKAATIIEVSRSVVAGRLDLEGLDRFDDDEVVSRLTRLDGIGRWSAEYVLLRGLGRLNVFPGDDVGARNNLAPWLGLEPPLDYVAVKRALARWQPYAGMIYFHLLLGRLEAMGQLDRKAASPAADAD